MFCSLLLVGSVGFGPQVTWMRVGLLLTFIWRAVPTQEDVPGWTATDGVSMHGDRCLQRASVFDHHRLSLLLEAEHSEATLNDHLPCPTTRQDSFFTFEAWSPSAVLRTTLSGSAKLSQLRDRLGNLHALPGRAKAVLVQPQAFRDCVQFVLPASDPATLTLLVDSGTAVICVDAPRVKVGSAILAALKVVYPDHDFRLVPPLGPLRHGDVVKAFQDDAITFAVGGLQPPGTLSPAASWFVRGGRIASQHCRYGPFAIARPCEGQSPIIEACPDCLARPSTLPGCWTCSCG